MADITFDEKEHVLSTIMGLKWAYSRTVLPDDILIEKADKAIDMLNKVFEGGE